MTLVVLVTFLSESASNGVVLMVLTIMMFDANKTSATKLPQVFDNIRFLCSLRHFSLEPFGEAIDVLGSPVGKSFDGRWPLIIFNLNKHF